MDTRSDTMHNVDLIPIVIVAIAIFVSAGYLLAEFIRAQKA